MRFRVWNFPSKIVPSTISCRKILHLWNRQTLSRSRFADLIARTEKARKSFAIGKLCVRVFCTKWNKRSSQLTNKVSMRLVFRYIGSYSRIYMWIKRPECKTKKFAVGNTKNSAIKQLIRANLKVLFFIAFTCVQLILRMECKQLLLKQDFSTSWTTQHSVSCGWIVRKNCHFDQNTDATIYIFNHAQSIQDDETMQVVCVPKDFTGITGNRAHSTTCSTTPVTIE